MSINVPISGRGYHSHQGKKFNHMDKIGENTTKISTKVFPFLS
jgi:hypothetical protein